MPFLAFSNVATWKRGYVCVCHGHVPTDRIGWWTWGYTDLHEAECNYGKLAYPRLSTDQMICSDLLTHVDTCSWKHWLPDSPFSHLFCKFRTDSEHPHGFPATFGLGASLGPLYGLAPRLVMTNMQHGILCHQKWQFFFHIPS